MPSRTPGIERWAKEIQVVFVVIYRWKLKPGTDEEFRDAWRRATEAIYQHRGSLGSRLLKADDGTYYATAQWPTQESWERRSEPEDADPEASQLMRQLTETSYPPVRLTLTDACSSSLNQGLCSNTHRTRRQRITR